MYKYVRPLFFKLDPETAHDLVVTGLHLAGPFLPLLSPWLRVSDPGLERTVFGLRFPNPVGLAAGFDKKGELAGTWERLGFGFAELGTYTALAQDGNPRPRVHRYPAQKAVINRMGFPNPGAEAVARDLAVRVAGKKRPRIPIGINLGKSKATPLADATQDYLRSLELLSPYGDYIAVNVSSPNTPGLRTLQEAAPLKGLLTALVRSAHGKPVLLKLAPDLGERDLEQAAETALGAGCAGLIATNTTVGRSGLPPGTYPEGGLSGLPLRDRSLEVIGSLAKFTKGRVPLIGVGGVFTAADVQRMMDAGASLVQVYTGFIYEGPTLCAGICRGLLGQKPA